MRRFTLVGFALLFVPRVAQAQEIVTPGVLRTEQTDEIVPEVSVRARPAPRSASDWSVDQDIVAASPHPDGADLLNLVPGAFVGDRALLGRAPRLSLRGFDGTAGQDVEIFVGNIPLNQVSNLRAPGYADMRLVIPEVAREVRVQHGPFDPHQGDFAIAGSIHTELGLEPGFWGRGTYGSFGSRRVMLAFAPDNHEWRDTFAAFEGFASDGPGGGRGGERGSFLGQLAFSGGSFRFKGTASLGAARFDFPGFLPQEEAERGYPYRALTPLGRDRTSFAILGTEFAWTMGRGVLTLGAFATKNKVSFHQNLTGALLDPVNGDDAEQTNDAATIGLNTSYRRAVKLTSKRDQVELGAYARMDAIDQRDVRVRPDGSAGPKPVDATIGATNVASFVDVALYPIRRVVVRGGPRLDSLAYTVRDNTGNKALESTSQGFHLGGKAVVDWAIEGGLHAMGSYGNGFRSPQARRLGEGERVPFAEVHALEGGLRFVERKWWRSSVTVFGSWLDRERVFDGITRENLDAPSSRRIGGSATFAAHHGPFGTSSNVTYARAEFSGSDARFTAGTLVPYAPQLTVRSDSFLTGNLRALGPGLRDVIWRVGAGVEAAAVRALPPDDAGVVRSGKNVFYVDANASLKVEEFELTLSALNLLNAQYYDAQYTYPSTLPRAGGTAPHVLVANPTTVFATLQIHFGGREKTSHDGPYVVD